MKRIYQFALYLVLPLILLRLLWRSLRLPAYRKRVSERFGFYPFQLKQSIWVHAVSVGEVIASAPLVKALQAAHPESPILLTTMTPTGSERVRAIFKDTVYHVYLPYDYPFAIKRFFNAMHPSVGVMIETELWPNLLAIAQDHAIPLYLLNARLSEQSLKGYQWILGLIRPALQSFHAIAAVSQADRERFIKLGADENRVHDCGNIKFDLTLPENLPENTRVFREKLRDFKFIWCAASTHAGEEEKIICAHEKLLAAHPDSLLMLAPRHPDRFNEVFQLVSARFKTVRRSLDEPVMSDTKIYLADTMGELLLIYSVSDVAFVGGSFVSTGGHNMLEPAALAKPIIMGESVFNFADIAKQLVQKNALVIVGDEEALSEQLCRLCEDAGRREALGEAALSVMKANKGALQKQLAVIKW